MGEYIKKHFNKKFGVNLVLGAEMSDMKNLVNFKIKPHEPRSEEEKNRHNDDDLPL
jgi:hypothetical protein